jgi:hypothetical protein
MNEALKSLMPCFQFDPSDLAANQHGDLSPAQYRRLGERTGSCFLIALVLAVPVMLFVSIFSANTGNRSGSVFCFSMIGLTAWSIRVEYLRSSALRSDLMNGKVAAIRGAIQVSKESSMIRSLLLGVRRMESSYYLSVGGSRFHITARQHAWCKKVPFKVFTVYYAPESGILLTLEPGDTPLNDGS